MLFALKRKPRQLKKNKLNARLFSGAPVFILCNLKAIIETKIDGITSYYNSVCSAITKKSIRFFIKKTIMMNISKFSNIYFKELFLNIDTEKSSISNFQNKNDSLTVTKTTVIT